MCVFARAVKLESPCTVIMKSVLQHQNLNVLVVKIRINGWVKFVLKKYADKCNDHRRSLRVIWPVGGIYDIRGNELLKTDEPPPNL
jgi:hypothetical protein